MNTATHANKINFQGAISNSDGELELYDPGHSDWGYRTRPPEGERTGSPTIVKSISPASILSRPEVADTTPLIFKVDIEGGERDLFSGDTAWMNRFPLIIIELHDWMLPFSGSSKSFLKAIASRFRRASPRRQFFLLQPCHPLALPFAATAASKAAVCRYAATASGISAVAVLVFLA